VIWKKVIGTISELVDSLRHHRFRCPCCKYKTLSERAKYEICAVCFWEDDGQDDNEEVHMDECFGVSGPNGDLSFAKARENFEKFGAVEERLAQYTRRPYLWER
jgi:hypothetical protein